MVAGGGFIKILGAKKWRVWWVGFWLPWFTVVGCMSPAGPQLKPLTEAQEAFVKIKRLHEEGKSETVVRRATRFLERYREESLMPPVKYYLAFHLDKEGHPETARKYYNEIAKLHRGTGWAVLAQSHLKSLDPLRERE